MASPHTTAVVVTYNSLATIGDTLSAAGEAHRAGEVEVIVVDNASVDGTVDFVRTRFPWTRVVAQPRNAGFASGCNTGASLATTEYILLLNPDAAIDRASLRRLHDFLAADPTRGMAGPAIVYPDGHLQHVGPVTTPWQLIRRQVLRRGQSGHRDIQPHGAPFETTWMCGAVLMIRTALYREVGGMDPRYFLYFEETDLCLAVHRHGSTLWIVGEAVAHHEGGASTRGVGRRMENGCLPEHYFPSRFYYLWKNFGSVKAVLTEAMLLAVTAASAAANFVRLRKDQRLRLRLRGGVFRLPARVPEHTNPPSAPDEATEDPANPSPGVRRGAEPNR